MFNAVLAATLRLSSDRLQRARRVGAVSDKFTLDVDQRKAFEMAISGEPVLLVQAGLELARLISLRLSTAPWPPFNVAPSNQMSIEFRDFLHVVWIAACVLAWSMRSWHLTLPLKHNLGYLQWTLLIAFNPFSMISWLTKEERFRWPSCWSFWRANIGCKDWLSSAMVINFLHWFWQKRF